MEEYFSEIKSTLEAEMARQGVTVKTESDVTDYTYLGIGLQVQPAKTSHHLCCQQLISNILKDYDTIHNVNYKCTEKDGLVDIFVSFYA